MVMLLVTARGRRLASVAGEDCGQQVEAVLAETEGQVSGQDREIRTHLNTEVRRIPRWIGQGRPKPVEPGLAVDAPKDRFEPTCPSSERVLLSLSRKPVRAPGRDTRHHYGGAPNRR